jgi:hypothetical protein
LLDEIGNRKLISQLPEMYAYFTLLYFTLKPPIRSGRINTTATVTGG